MAKGSGKMKRFLLCVLRGLMNLIYAVMKLLTAPGDRVLFISRQSDTPGENFLLIAEEIRKRSPGTQLRFSCKKDKSGLYGFGHPLLMLDRMRLLAGSRVCVTESGTAEIGILKHRKELRVIQIWNTMAPFRRFAWQTVDAPGGIDFDTADGLRLHGGYDYIIVGSEFARDIFSEAMNTDKSRVLALGLPITDTLPKKDSEQAKFKLWRLHPSTCGKKTVLYAPTGRNGNAPCEEFVACFDYGDAAPVIKLHPGDCHTVINDRRAIVDTEMTIIEAISAADVIVTDYSGVCAEACLLDKPVYFYTPDRERFAGSVGLNIDPAELFPEITFDSAEKLTEAIKNGGNKDSVRKMREMLAGSCKGDSAKSIADLVLEALQTSDNKKASFKRSGLRDFAARCSYGVKYLGLKIDPKLILFESKATQTYDGAVKELYEKLLADKRYGSCRFAWAVTEPEEESIPGNGTVLAVKFGSSEHMQLHARARAIVSDAPVSERVKLRRQQDYILADNNAADRLRRAVIS